MQFESIVIRIFDVDFMLLELIFTAIWIFVLDKKGYITPLFFGLFGIMINMVVDYGVLYSTHGVRTVEGLPCRKTNQVNDLRKKTSPIPPSLIPEIIPASTKPTERCQA